MSRSTLASNRFVAPVLAGLLCVALQAWQVERNNSTPSTQAEPAIGAVTASDWTELPNIKNARFEASAVQYQGDVYAFNGFGQSIKVEPTVEKLDADTLTWSVIGETSIELGNAVTHNGIVLNGNEVWIIGGRVGNHPGPVTADVWKFNLDSRVWTPGPTLPVPGAAGGAALVNNRIHWFGGLDTAAQCDVDHHFVFDLNDPSGGWQDISSIAPMPVPRNHFATVVLDGLIYAMGGQFTHDGCGQGTPDTELSHVFDPNTNTWNQIASLPAVQSHTEPSTFVHLGAIYMIGGATKGTTVFRYNRSIDQWDSVAQLPQPLLAPVARVLNGQLIVSSGGAPAIVPSFKTYKTDMAPLLLPSAQNTQNTNETNNDPDNTESGNNDTSSNDNQEQPDGGGSDTADSGPGNQSDASANADSADCDYSNAAANNGWGWNPIAQISCPPLTVTDAGSQTPQTPVETDNETPDAPAVTDSETPQTPATDESADSESKNNDQPTSVVINPDTQSNNPEAPEENGTTATSSSGGGAADYLFALLLTVLILRTRRGRAYRSRFTT